MLISSLPTVNVTPDTLDTAALYANLSKSILYVRHQTVGNALKLCSWKIAFSIKKKEEETEGEGNRHDHILSISFIGFRQSVGWMYEWGESLTTGIYPKGKKTAKESTEFQQTADTQPVQKDSFFQAGIGNVQSSWYPWGEGCVRIYDLHDLHGDPYPPQPLLLLQVLEYMTGKGCCHTQSNKPQWIVSVWEHQPFILCYWDELLPDALH